MMNAKREYLFHGKVGSLCMSVIRDYLSKILFSAEREGFEPSIPLRYTRFKRALSHSATSPC